MDPSWVFSSQKKTEVAPATFGPLTRLRHQWLLDNLQILQSSLRFSLLAPALALRFGRINGLDGNFTGLSPIFNEKIYGFRLRFSLKPIH
jgi:hypothetical protein